VRRSAVRALVRTHYPGLPGVPLVPVSGGFPRRSRVRPPAHEGWEARKQDRIWSKAMRSYGRQETDAA
jgi:hypothetical protein